MFNTSISVRLYLFDVTLLLAGTWLSGFTTVH